MPIISKAKLFENRTVEFYTTDYKSVRHYYKSIPNNKINIEHTRKWTDVTPMHNAKINGYDSFANPEMFLCIEKLGFKSYDQPLGINTTALIPYKNLHIVSSYTAMKGEQND